MRQLNTVVGTDGRARVSVSRSRGGKERERETERMRERQRDKSMTTEEIDGEERGRKRWDG